MHLLFTKIRLDYILGFRVRGSRFQTLYIIL